MALNTVPYTAVRKTWGLACSS